MKTSIFLLSFVCVAVALASAFPRRGEKLPNIWHGLIGYVDIIPTREDPDRENEVEVDREGSFIMQDVIVPEKVAGRATPNVFGGRLVDFE